VSSFGKSVALNAAQRAGNALGHVFVAVVSNNEAAARNQVDEPLERGLYGIEVGVDVGVIELNVRMSASGK
jgi:hypothetical protein